MLFSEDNQPQKKAIAYYRHSAEDKQENSVAIQRQHIEKFAKEHNIQVIHEEADEGVSGLTENRLAFKRLFREWIENQDAPGFDYVLVYDTSRWGRFQDPDKAAYFEQLCRERNHQVIYVARGFPEEKNKLISHLQSSIERYMNADYSRQLSDKVFYGSVEVSKQGYSAGGTACYGMSRLLLDESKKPIGLLKKGEHKMISNQRVTFVPTGDGTTEVVKRVFRDLVFGWKQPDEIAEDLNNEQIPSASGNLWNRTKVIRILTNEAYVGTRIYNKRWNRLKQGQKDNPKSDWVYCYEAFPSIVDTAMFKEAQERLYFSLPSQYNKGLVLQKRMLLRVKEELWKEILIPKFNEETSFWILRNFPITTSVTFYQSGVHNEKTTKWVFSIPEEFRKFECVIGIGLSMDEKKPIREVFLLPSSSFDQSNLLIFKEGDEGYSKYLLMKERLKDMISKVIEDMGKKFCIVPETLNTNLQNSLVEVKS